MRRLCAVVAFAIAAARGVAQASTPVAVVTPQDSVGRVTFRVIPDTVTVGQPFEVRLRAVPPRGRQALAPAVPDTGGIVEPLDPAQVTRRADTLLVRYRLLAWQPGVLTIPLGPVLMRRDSNDVSVPVDVRVVVASVLPADSSDRIPKDPRELFAFAEPWWARWWQWALLALALATLVGVVVWWRRRPPKEVVVETTPLSRAEEAFARLDARQLISAGEGGRHVALAGEIVRQYLADIEMSLALALTNAELLQAVRPVAGLPDQQLANFFHRVDAVRFGGTRADDASVRQVAGLAREVVRDIDRVRAALNSQQAA